MPSWLNHDFAVRIAVGLATAAVIAMMKYYWNRLIPVMRGIALHAPEPFRRLLRKSADTVYPNWRRFARLPRTQASLEWRLERLRENKVDRFFILGGLYVDLFISPVDTDDLTAGEFSNLERVRIDCGGSACHVGRHLYQDFGYRSEIYSRCGRDDQFRSGLHKLVKRENWAARVELTQSRDAQSATSVHLMQAGHAHYTTFTHRGALESLDWQKVPKRLSRKTKRGGVLHISGYLRTRLDRDLHFHLERLPSRLLVCLDHGRFAPEDHHQSLQSLLEALEYRSIDIYICTLSELCHLMSVAEPNMNVRPGAPILNTLANFSRSNRLPRVTVVRGRLTPTTADAFVLLDGVVKKIEVTTDDITGVPGFSTVSRRRPRPGPRNSFNAGLISSIGRGDPTLPLRTMVADAVRTGLINWLKNDC